MSSSGSSWAHPPRRTAAGLYLVAAIVVAASVVVVLPSSLGAPAGGRTETAAPASSPSFWTNLTQSVGLAPWNRSLTQAGYSPALNATVLFGGYNGFGANVPIGDTWMFENHTWTEQLAAGGPAARWGASLVYDPVDRALVMFGGRNVTGFFNDTWIYNGTGWHNVTTAIAPSPRYDYGMVYDPALGSILLYGGARGNDPAGSFSPFVYLDDTWAYQDGTWTNLTASAGSPPPAGRLIRGQMAYDAADGFAVLTGGYQYTPYMAGCGLASFDPAWAETWTFGPTGWSRQSIVGASPPSGAGAVWYDRGTGEVLEYIGLLNGTPGSCPVPGAEVWGYAAGNWSELTSAAAGAPSGRILPMVVDDTGDQQEILFGGQRVVGFWVGHYLADTWAFYPGGDAPSAPTVPGASVVTVKETGLVPTTGWGVRFSDYTLNATVPAGARREVRSEEPNGVDGFVVRPLPGYGIARVTGASGPSYGSVRVDGRTSITVHFGKLETVEFLLSDRGARLPVGAAWGVTLVPRGRGESTQVYSATTRGSDVEFTLPAGAEYTFFVHGPAGYAAVHASGSLTVAAHAMDHALKFRIGATDGPAARPDAAGAPAAAAEPSRPT